MSGSSARTRVESLLLAAGLLLLPARSFGFEVGGSYKVHLNWVYDALWRGESSGIADNQLRLELGLSPARPLSLQLAYVLRPEIRSASLEAVESSYLSASAEYRIGDPAPRLLPASAEAMDDIALYQDLDRAVATLRLPFADLYVGRQAISWGSARVVNPTDILVPFGILRPDTEYRPGVDAVRLRIPFAGMDELDLGYVAGEGFRFEASALFARSRLYLADTDLTLSGLLFRENLLAGLDVARAIGKAGAWLEAAWVLPDLAPKTGDPVRESYAGVSVGADYNFAWGLYGYLEYHFNSAGSADPQGYLELVQDAAAHPAYSEGNVYLLGRHYLSLGGTYPLTPLLPVSFLLMVNLSDLSAGLSLSADYNIRENIYLTGGLFLGLGPGPQLARGLPVRYRSEFGAYPNLFYTAVKVYF
jgi:hypothetical protein